MKRNPRRAIRALQIGCTLDDHGMCLHAAAKLEVLMGTFGEMRLLFANKTHDKTTRGLRTAQLTQLKRCWEGSESR